MDFKLSCDDAVKLIESKGRYLDISFGGYNSDSKGDFFWEFIEENQIDCY